MRLWTRLYGVILFWGGGEGDVILIEIDETLFHEKNLWTKSKNMNILRKETYFSEV